MQVEQDTSEIKPAGPIKTWDHINWNDIRDTLTAEELRDIIEAGFDVGLDQAIQDFIEANYEGEWQ